jgi:hypothetical protein
MNTVTTNWKTSLAGVLLILGAVIHVAVCYLNGQPISLAELGGAFTIGGGLIVAKDGSTHSTPFEVAESGVKAAAKSGT